MARIFVSYSRKNEEFARKLADDLAHLGADVWIDVDDIRAGVNWSTAIQHGLEMSDVLLLIMTPDSMASPNVENEWQFFLECKHPIIPILLEPVRPHFQLIRLQYVDFHSKPYDVALTQLHSELLDNGIQLALLTNTAPDSQMPRQKPLLTQTAMGGSASRKQYSSLVFVVVAIGSAVFLLAFLSGAFDGLRGSDHADRASPTVETVNETFSPTPDPIATDTLTEAPEPMKTAMPEPTTMPDPTATDIPEPTKMATPRPTKTLADAIVDETSTVSGHGLTLIIPAKWVSSVDEDGIMLANSEEMLANVNDPDSVGPEPGQVGLILMPWLTEDLVGMTLVDLMEMVSEDNDGELTEVEIGDYAGYSFRSSDGSGLETEWFGIEASPSVYVVGYAAAPEGEYDDAQATIYEIVASLTLDE